MIVLTGLLRRGEHKGKYLNCVEFDNKKGKALVSTDSNGVVLSLKEMAVNTVVEEYGDPDRAHVYFITSRPMVSKLT